MSVAVERVQGLAGALLAELAALPADLDAQDRMAVADLVQNLQCALPGVEHRMLAELQTSSTPKAFGATSWRDVFSVRWRIAGTEASRRLFEAADLAPRVDADGEPVEAVLPFVAAAVRHGLITPEQIGIIRRAMTKLAGSIQGERRADFESELVHTAMNTGPQQLRDKVRLRLKELDHEESPLDERERARRRGASMSAQGEDGMSTLTMTMTPAARAIFEVLLAKLEARGMCNPADEFPCRFGTPTQAQIDDDTRTLVQRRHDAMVEIGRRALVAEDRGTLNGLPMAVLVRTTLEDLEARAGLAVTGGGTLIPIDELLRMAAQGQADHYLGLFDGATGSAMNLYRAKRTASLAQRLMLILRDGGCTKPGCSAGPYRCQVHHAAADWADDGQTNVDELGLACGPDNRDVGPDGWTTRMSPHHRVEWIPPAGLDTGQARINDYHLPPHPDDLIDDYADPDPEEPVVEDPDPNQVPIVLDDDEDGDEIPEEPVDPAVDSGSEPVDPVADPEPALFGDPGVEVAPDDPSDESDRDTDRVESRPAATEPVDEPALFDDPADPEVEAPALPPEPAESAPPQEPPEPAPPPEADLVERLLTICWPGLTDVPPHKDDRPLPTGWRTRRLTLIDTPPEPDQPGGPEPNAA